MITLDQLVGCLTGVERIAPVEGSGTAVTWTGGTLGLPGGHVFGGQMIGQSLMIASRTHPDKAVHSISMLFPRGARDTGSLDYTATTLHAGAAYATTRVELAQTDRSGRPTVGCSAQLLHHSPGPGLEHRHPMPDAGTPADARPVEFALLPWETRVVGDTDLDDRRVQDNRLTFWMRADADLPDDPALHQALLSFGSELTLIATSLLPHDGWSQLDAHDTLRTTVLAHTVVFHRPLRMDGWLLVDQAGIAASAGTVSGSGNVFDESGELVASFLQESMVRVEQER